MLLKNKHKRLFTALFLLLLFISSGISQELFTLQELAEKTLQENYQIRIARKEASIEKNNNTLGNAGFLPTLSLNAEQGFSREDSRSNFYTGASRVGQGARQTSGQAFIELDWIIFDGLKMFARRDKLSHFEQSEILTVKYYIEQTIADLAKAYFYLKKEHEKLKKYQQTLSVSKYRLKLEKQRETIGSGNSLLYQQALVDLLADSAKVIDQQSTINNIQVQINQVINRDLDAPILPSSEDIILEEKKQNKDSLIQKVLQSNIELKKAQLNQLIAECNHKIEAGDRFPEIALFGNYSYSEQTLVVWCVESSNRFGPQYGIRIRFNLFDGSKENLQIKNARIKEDISDLEKNQRSKALRSTLNQRLNDHESLVRQRHLLKESIKAARESLDIAQKQFELGAINGYDFRLTQNALTRIQEKKISVELAIQYTRIDILRLSGRLIKQVI